MSPLVTQSGLQVQLGDLLGRGGEGAVYEVPAYSGVVAKLYHEPIDPDKQAKLEFMAATADRELLSIAAWPQATLYQQRRGAVAGFVMPRMSGRQPIHELYSPSYRRQKFPDVGWDFLVLAARNTAAAFSSVHARGHVVGDVNQGNLLVGNDARVSLIDCDSFQVNANGRLHLCEVGVSHFTPPELQGRGSFAGVKRTTNHDNFGLALLVFHTLFGGRHPFAGVLQAPGGGELEPNISSYRYAYARDAKHRGIAPPPQSLPISLVPWPVEAMFTQAFTEPGASSRRPSADDWVHALDGLRGSLQRCSVSRMHLYSQHLHQCPWCEMDGRGVIYFIDLRASVATGQSSFDLAKVWALIEAVSPPPPLRVPDPATMVVEPARLPPELNTTSLKVFLRVLLLALASLAFFMVEQLTALVLTTTFWLWMMVGKIGAAKRKEERARRAAAVETARKLYVDAVSQARTASTHMAFANKRKELEDLRAQYQRAPSAMRQELDDLQYNAQVRQCDRFLRGFHLDEAVIPGVGSAKKAALMSFGIETAADVDRDRVSLVRGFGDVLTKAVLNWRHECQRRFVFNAQTAVTAADRNAVAQKWAIRQRTLEASLAAGPSELYRLRMQALASTQAAEAALAERARALAQSLADAKAL